MSKPIQRLMVGACSALLVLGTQLGVARADKVLIYQTKNNDVQGGDAAGSEAALVFQALGHTVTLVSGFAPSMPPDLSVFDTVWVIQLPPISGADRNALIAYANAGGGLYVTGERGCCEALNMSVQQITASLLRPPNPTIGATPLEGGDLFTPTPANPFGITTTPKLITQWQTLAAGLVSANVNANRAVFQNAAGKYGAVLYPPEDFKYGGSGCLYISMDLTFWQANVAPSQDLSLYVQNIEHFLSTCADSDHDGLTDEFEVTSGTDPADPDTDNDGLCDGYGTVQGVCISGEQPLDDFDGDGIIPPLDDDDDNDGIPTAFEVGAEGKAPNVDGDANPAWLDPDSDNDGFIDSIEGTNDTDKDGIPGIVDADDVPTPCSSDPNCGDATSGIVCNLDIGGYCQPGCRGTNGNGCPTDQTCTSTDDTIGQCVGGNDGGVTDAGTGGSGGSATGGSSNGGTTTGGATTGGATSGGGSGGSAKPGESSDDGGCGCGVPGSAPFRWSVLALAAAAFAFVRRRAR